MVMKEFFIYIFVSFLIVSCESKNDVIDDAVEKEESCSFVKIEYYALNDGRSFPHTKILSIDYSNSSAVEQTFSVTPASSEGKFETSHFNNDAGAVVIEDLYVYVPVQIDEEGIILFGNKKWKYSSIVQIQNSDLTLSVDVIIPPYKQSVTTVNLFFKQFKANYRLFLKGDQTGKEKIIDGVWTGIYPDYLEINTLLFDL
jgi:hypothetical protein